MIEQLLMWAIATFAVVMLVLGVGGVLIATLPMFNQKHTDYPMSDPRSVNYRLYTAYLRARNRADERARARLDQRGWEPPVGRAH